MSSEGSIKAFNLSVRSVIANASNHVLSRPTVSRQAVSQPTVSRPTILIADDHEDSLLYAREAATYLGYDVVSTGCAQDVLALALNHSPNVILLDLLLEGMHGKEVFQQLQDSGETTNIPVVAVTAMITELDKLKASKLSFSGFLEKPYLIEDLAVVLNSIQADVTQANSVPTEKASLAEKEKPTGKGKLKEKERPTETADRLHRPISVN